MAEISPFVGYEGQQRTADMIKLVGDNFSGSSLIAQYWSSTLANGGTAIVATGLLSIETNTTANGSAIVTGVPRGRFLPGSSNMFYGNIRFLTAAAANNTRRWGAFDANNGAYFEFFGTTIAIVTRRGGTNTVTTVFNGDGAFKNDTNQHRYEILYSEESIQFYQDHILIHDAVFNIAPWTNNYNLPIRFENTNTGGNTTDYIMEVRGASVMRFGQPITRPLFYNVTTNETRNLKDTSGTLHRIIVNQPGTGGASITFYDNTTGDGTAIGKIDTTLVRAGIELNVDFNTGLTYVSSTTLGDVTIIYD